jgi:hypothetical protein
MYRRVAIGVSRGGPTPHLANAIPAYSHRSQQAQQAHIATRSDDPVSPANPDESGGTRSA